MKNPSLHIEELEQRAVPSILGSALSVAVELPDAAADQGVTTPAPSAAVDDAAVAADGANGVTVS